MRKIRLHAGLIAACLAFSAGGAQAATVEFGGGSTTVALDAGTVGALTGAGIAVTPTGTASLVGLNATFPITGGSLDTDNNEITVPHDGSGLRLTQGSTVVDLANYLIAADLDTETGVLTGLVTLAGGTVPGAPLFNIGPGLNLTLTSTAAGVLSSEFGLPDLTGAPVGVAQVQPSAIPEPISMTLMASGLGALYLRRRLSRR